MTRLSVERLFSSPSLNGSVPIQVRFSPDGARVTYLANPPEDRERLDLYAYDIETGTSHRLIDASRIDASGELTAAEKAERERRRQFSTGVSTYRWLPDSAAHLLHDRRHRLSVRSRSAFVARDHRAKGCGKRISRFRRRTVRELRS